MKKIHLLLAILLLENVFNLKAQDTLLFENFNNTSFFSSMINPADIGGLPGNSIDAAWYNYDGDGGVDGSASPTTRGASWFQFSAFADSDTVGNYSVIAANSWFADPGAAYNLLITPSIQLGTADTLFWKSAPLQTPRFLDGYKVLLSTTNNSEVSFTNLLYTAAEMTGEPVDYDTTFADFHFSTGYVHGADSTYIQTPAYVPVDHPEKIAYHGRLCPCFAPLNAYANQKVFIAFLHDSYDDNMISLDDVMIRGTIPLVGINENTNDLGLNIFPNPASDNAQVNYNLSAETNVLITVSDVTGKLIASEDKGAQQQGHHFTNINTALLAKGFYTVSVRTVYGTSTSKLIVQ